MIIDDIEYFDKQETIDAINRKMNKLYEQIDYWYKMLNEIRGPEPEWNDMDDEFDNEWMVGD